MFRVYTVRDVVRIDPSNFGRPLNEVALEELKDRYEGKIDRNLGVIIMVYDPEVEPMGYLILGDGASYHRVTFKMLAYIPVINEVVEGIVHDVRRIGLFVSLGPIDGFTHISQVSDEEVQFDDARRVIVCRQSKRFVERGDIVRARITNVSTSGPANIFRVSMTMRQPFLGKKEWIDEYVRKIITGGKS
ncbi:MAG: DNA-directed RNA polymerase [Thermoprotei archaeon]|nr:MAG: DNA-directed RNA polymerase [Thermoprotei archaeon]